MQKPLTVGLMVWLVGCSDAGFNAEKRRSPLEPNKVETHSIEIEDQRTPEPANPSIGPTAPIAREEIASCKSHPDGFPDGIEGWIIPESVNNIVSMAPRDILEGYAQPIAKADFESLKAHDGLLLTRRKYHLFAFKSSQPYQSLFWSGVLAKEYRQGVPSGPNQKLGISIWAGEHWVHHVIHDYQGQEFHLRLPNPCLSEIYVFINIRDHGIPPEDDPGYIPTVDSEPAPPDLSSEIFSTDSVGLSATDGIRPTQCAFYDVERTIPFCQVYLMVDD